MRRNVSVAPSVPGSRLQASVASIVTTGRSLSWLPIMPSSGSRAPSALVPEAQGFPSMPSYIARSTTSSTGAVPTDVTRTEKRRPRASGNSSDTLMV